MSKQFTNDVASCVRDSVNGLLWQNPSTLTRLPGTDAIVTKNIDTNKVQLICGGGSGHEPSHAGFVFNGCLDGAVCGGVFASPSHKAVFETLKYFRDCKKGVLVIIKNYQGDIINFNLAAQMAKAQFGMNVECVVFGEDVTFSYEGDARRGLAGTTLFYKILGQIALKNTADASFDVTKLAQVGKNMISRNSFLSYGVALESCALPGKTKPNVDLAANEMECGLGIHGEAGNERLKSIIKVDEIISKMLNKVLKDDISGNVVLALNNLGSVTELEMGILVNSIMNQVASSSRTSFKDVKLVRLVTGRFMTSLDMKGISLTSVSNFANDEEFNTVLAALDSPLPSSIQFSSVNTENITELEKIEEQQQEQGNDSKTAVSESSPEGTAMRKVLESVFTQINNAADKFDELDAAVGDGDMGRGVSRGMVAALALLPTLNFSQDAKEAFSLIGSAIADAHAGSSGPMLGALVAVGGQQLFSSSASELLNSSNSEKSIQSFLQAIVAGVDSIQQIGGAQEGDRTMVDVLSPIRTAIQNGDISSSKFNNDRKQVLGALVKLAKEKADGAAQLTAKKGRSRYAEERCVGKPDPGCEFIVFVLETLAHVEF